MSNWHIQRGPSLGSATGPGDGLALTWRGPAPHRGGLAPGRPRLGLHHPRAQRLAAPRRPGMDDPGMDELPVVHAGLAARQPIAPPRRCGAAGMMAANPARCGGDPATRRRRRVGRASAGLGGPRVSAALERPALVAEIIRHVTRRGKVPRPRRRLDGVNRRARQRGGKRHADRDRQPAPASVDDPAQAHRLPSFPSAFRSASPWAFHSAKLIRSIRNKSLVRAYQPRPCMRPTRRIFSVAT